MLDSEQDHLDGHPSVSQGLTHRVMLTGGLGDGNLQGLSPQEQQQLQQQQQQRQEAFTTAESQLMQQLLRDPLAQSTGTQAALDRLSGRVMSPIPSGTDSAMAAPLASGASFSDAVAAAAGSSAAATLALQGGSSGVRDPALTAAMAARWQWNQSPGAQAGVLGSRAMDTSTVALLSPVTSVSLSQGMLGSMAGPIQGSDALRALRGSYTTMGRQDDAVAGFLRHTPHVPMRLGSQTSSGGMPTHYLSGGLGLPTLAQGEQFGGMGISQDVDMRSSDQYGFSNVGSGSLGDLENALGGGGALRPSFPFVNEDLSLFGLESVTDVGFGNSSMMKGMDSAHNSSALSWGPTPFME